MEQKIDFTAVNTVIWNGEDIEHLKLDIVNLWDKYEPVVFNVVKKTSRMQFKVTAGVTDVVVDYGGLQITIPAGTTANATYTDTDTPESGTITFTGDVVRIDSGVLAGSAKQADTGLGNITGIVSWGCLREIGDYLFAETDLDVVDFSIPNRIMSIGEYAFTNSNVQKVKLPDYPVTVGRYMFQDADISEFEIPDWLTILPYLMFCDCKNLKTITIPSTVTGWGEGENSLVSAATFEGSGLQTVIIEPGLTHIGYRAFYGCSSLTSVSLPNTITSLNAACFYSSALTSIALPSSLEVINYDAFKSTKLTTLTIPANVNKIDYSIVVSCANLTSVVFENPNGWVDSDGNSVDFSVPANNVAKLQKTSGYYYTRS